MHVGATAVVESLPAPSAITKDFPAAVFHAGPGRITGRFASDTVVVSPTVAQQTVETMTTRLVYFSKSVDEVLALLVDHCTMRGVVVLLRARVTPGSRRAQFGLPRSVGAAAHHWCLPRRFSGLSPGERAAEETHVTKCWAAVGGARARPSASRGVCNVKFPPESVPYRSTCRSCCVAPVVDRLQDVSR